MADATTGMVRTHRAVSNQASRYVDEQLASTYLDAPSGTASTRTPDVPVLGPPFAYYGGKTRLAPMIAAALPDHTQYVEPYVGSPPAGVSQGCRCDRRSGTPGFGGPRQKWTMSPSRLLTVCNRSE